MTGPLRLDAGLRRRYEQLLPKDGEGLMATPSNGRFNWHELMTSDAAGAAKFYAALFGWTVKEMPTPDGPVPDLHRQGDVGVGARHGRRRRTVPRFGCRTSVSKTPTPRGGDHPGLGGQVMVPPTTVFDMVRFA